MATHSIGRRLILNPYEMGSMSNLEFLNNTNPDSARQTWPHFNWETSSTSVAERSWRVWEPGRMALSDLGLVEEDPDNTYATEQRTQGCTVRGIKGDIIVKPVNAVFYDADTGLPFSPPAGFKYGDVFGRPIPGAATADGVSQQSDASYFSTAPLFMAMYMGKFSVVDDGVDEGGTIDSGPLDDPDTLLSLDITNPSVIESNRLAWWAMETVTMPTRNWTFQSGVPGDGSWSHPVKKIPLSLSENFMVAKDKVLWIHLSFGLVATPFLLADSEGSIRRLAYRPTAHFEMVASMIASPWAVK